MSKKNVAVSAKILVYRRDHPGERASYGISGVAGLAVIDKRLFANGKAPKTITLDCDLTVPEEKEVKPAKGKAAEA